jgi:hypothetical protein
MSRTVTSLDELAPLLDLENVQVHETAGRRRDAFDLSHIPVAEHRPEVRVRQALQDNVLAFRARIEFSTRHAVIVADVAAYFRLTETIARPPAEVLDGFARQIGLPTVLPYLRVQVQQTARQLGVPAPMLKHYWAKDLATVRFAAEGGR